MEHQAALDKLKDTLTSSHALAYFDSEKTTHLTVDAGPQGLGAILAQGDGDELQVIAYASRSLTDPERNYSQIEKETLAVVWAIEHFNVYLYGTQFNLHTDHKPLISILTNPSARPSARIERLCLRIQLYNFAVHHQKGTENPSDYMSRHPLKFTRNGYRTDKVLDEYLLFLSQAAIPKAMTTKQVIEAATKDSTYCQLRQAIQAKGAERHLLWSATTLKPYRHLETELAVTPEGIIL